MTLTKAQTLAVETKGCTLLVSAAAGSGKTATLTQRIISELVGDGIHPGADLSRFLVVTFTKAAAAELKSRIGEALTRAIAQHPDNRHLSEQLMNLGNTKICTIDAFYNEPVKNHFAELGIPPQLQLADVTETAPLKEAVAAELSDVFYQKYGNAATGHNDFADLLDHLSSKKSSGAREAALLAVYDDLTRDADTVTQLQKANRVLENDINEGKDFLDTVPGTYLRSLFDDFLGEAVPVYQKALAEMQAESSGDDPDIAVFASEKDFYQDLQSNLSNLSYVSLQTAWNGLSFARMSPKRGDKKTPAVIKRRNYRDYFKDKHKILANYLSFSHPEVIRQVKQSIRSVNVLLDFVSAFDTAYRAAKEARGLCEFSDMRYYMLKLLLDDKGDPTEFATELQNTYDEVYIDEYQDVDAAQDAIFSVIGGDHRFMVGDIKQCIYAFRGSRPDIFAGYLDKLPPVADASTAPVQTGGTIFMSENFRCNEPIIRFTNEVSDIVFPACGSSVNYRPVDRLVHGKETPSVPQKPVTLALFEKPGKRGTDEGEDAEDGAEDNATEEYLWIADRIEDLLRDGTLDNGDRIRPEDIAVLMRKTEPLAQLETILSSRGIPTVLDRKGLDSATENKTAFLLSVLQTIDNPEQDTTLSQVLSSLFSFTPDDLLTVRRNAPASQSLYRAVNTFADGMNFSEEGKENNAFLRDLSEKCRYFLEWLKQKQHAGISMNTDLFVRRLWQDEHLSHLSADAAVTMICNDARAWQKNAPGSLHSYVVHLSRSLENGTLKTFKTETHAIVLLTEHRSKGLEFPVCFVAGLGLHFSTKESKKAFIHFVGDRTLAGIRLFDRDDTTNTLTHTKTLLHQLALRRLTRSSTQEEMRLLYVAMTRAREKLYLSGTVSKTEALRNTATLLLGGSPGAILDCTKSLEWVYAAAQHTDDVDCIEIVTPDTAAAETVQPTVTDAAPARVLPETETDDPTVAAYRKIFDGISSAKYGFSHLHTVPTGISASKASRNYLDSLQKTGTFPTADERETFDSLYNDWQQQAPLQLNGLASLNTAPAAATAAERGTAVHTFLQFCRWETVRDDGILAELDRLVDNGFMDKHDVDMVDDEVWHSLATGELASLVQQASALHREIKFCMDRPLTEFCTDETLKALYRNETIAVQGSIDLLLEMPNGELVLCDYKTDRVHTEKGETPDAYAARICERHRTQLELYADATERLFGKRPDRICLYSIPCRRIIPLQ